MAGGPLSCSAFPHSFKGLLVVKIMGRLRKSRLFPTFPELTVPSGKDEGVPRQLWHCEGEGFPEAEDANALPVKAQAGGSAFCGCGSRRTLKIPTAIVFGRGQEYADGRSRIEKGNTD